MECIFTWYWIADLWAREGIAFVLGHALYMKAIQGSKTKNDKIDSHKIAVLLRGGMLSMAYVYPSKMRLTRDLLRRRKFLMRKRAELITHILGSSIISPSLQKAIERALVNNRLSCFCSWEIAERLGIAKMDVSSACEKLKIKISSCQLGAF